MSDMSKIDRKQLVEKVKKDKVKKVTTSFTVDPEVLKQFVGTCEKEGISASSAIEQLMRDFVK